jgi:hypothetical protein
LRTEKHYDSPPDLPELFPYLLSQDKEYIGLSTDATADVISFGLRVVNANKYIGNS